MNRSALCGAMQVKLPDAGWPLIVPDELPVMITSVPSAPPDQVNSTPDDRVTLASSALFVQVSSGLGNTTEVSKLPTSFPPLPWNGKVPPVVGMNPEGNWEKNVPCT